MKNPMPDEILNTLEGMMDSGHNDVIPVFSGESFLSGRLGCLAALQDEGLNLKGFLTFGAQLSDNNAGNSHFTVVARELDVPICVAKIPLRYRSIHGVPRRAWEDRFPLDHVDSKLGAIGLSKYTNRLVVSTET